MGAAEAGRLETCVRLCSAQGKRCARRKRLRGLWEVSPKETKPCPPNALQSPEELTHEHPLLTIDCRHLCRPFTCSNLFSSLTTQSEASRNLLKKLIFRYVLLSFKCSPLSEAQKESFHPKVVRLRLRKPVCLDVGRQPERSPLAWQARETFRAVLGDLARPA